MKKMGKILVETLESVIVYTIFLFLKSFLTTIVICYHSFHISQTAFENWLVLKTGIRPWTWTLKKLNPVELVT